MSNGGINAQVMGNLILAAAQNPRISSTFPGVALERAAFEALSLVVEGTDPNELIEDFLAVAAHTVSIVIRSSHDGALCPGCIARSVFGYSLEVAAEIAADEAVNEPDEPPFSGSIN